MNIQAVPQDLQMKIAIEMQIDIITDTQGCFIPGFSMFSMFFSENNVKSMKEGLSTLMQDQQEDGSLNLILT